MVRLTQKYTWNQTETHVFIKVTVKIFQTCEARILLTENYIKVNFEQFFFEVFLTNSILEECSKFTVTVDEIIFELRKKELIKWSSLYKSLSKDKKNQLRDEILNGERKKHEPALTLADRMKESCNVKNSYALAVSQMTSNENPCQVKNLIPPIRPFGIIRFSFTPREFLTPGRESRVQQEKEWLKKDKEIREAAGFVAEDLSPEQQNSSWLQQKGDSFMKEDNYVGAVSIYSHALKLAPSMAIFYVKRSEAHLKLNNLHRVIEDTTKAVEMLDPITLENAAIRAQAHKNRGIALCKLGKDDAGNIEIQASDKILRTHLNSQ